MSISELGIFSGGGTPSTSNTAFWEGEIPWISSSDIDLGDIHTIRVKRFISDYAVKNSATKICVAPVILIVSRVGVGKVALSEQDICTSQDFVNISNLRGNKLFLCYSIAELMKTVSSNAQGTSIKGITSIEIKTKELFIPSDREQWKIASLLKYIDQRIETQSKIIDHLKSQIKDLSCNLFMQRLRLKDDSGNRFPKWRSLKGNEIFDNIANKKHHSDLPILAITQEHGAVPRDLIGYKVSVTDKSIESYKVVEKGDFIISLRSFQGGIEYSDYKGICSPAYIILRSKLKIDHRFYRFYLRSEDYIKSLNEKLEGIRDGKMISYKYFSEISLPFPSIDEQFKIANLLSSLEERIKIEKQVLANYKTQKKYFLNTLFI